MILQEKAKIIVLFEMVFHMQQLWEKLVEIWHKELESFVNAIKKNNLHNTKKRKSGNKAQQLFMIEK